MTRSRVLLSGLALVCVVVMVKLWSPSINPVHFKESESVISTKWPVDFFDFHAEWVQDCNQDNFPDLVVYYQRPPFWTFQQYNDLPGNWQVWVLSGVDGVEISSLQFSGPGTTLLGILDPTGIGGNFSFVALGRNEETMGLVSQKGQYQRLSDSEPIEYYNSRWFQTERGTYFCLSGYDRLSILTVNSGEIEVDFEVEGSSLLPCILPSSHGGADDVAWVDSYSPLDSVSHEEEHQIRVASLSSGLQSKVPLLLSKEFARFEPKHILWRFDQNGDGVLDWLLFGWPEPHMRWVDGNTGAEMQEISQMWSQISINEDPLNWFRLGSAHPVQAGLLHLHDSERIPGLLAVGLREWANGELKWSFDTPFPYQENTHKLSVTEFPDQDSDAVMEYGLVVQCNALDADGISTPNRGIEFRAFLVSGRTGENLLLRKGEF